MTYPADLLIRQTKANQSKLEKYTYLKQELFLDLFKGGYCQGREKEANMFTGADAQTPDLGRDVPREKMNK